MTFSIAARSNDGNCLGVAVASKFLAVGAYVPVAEAGSGAVATQSYANLAFRAQGLSMLRDGLDATRTLERLVASDERSSERQVGIVDSNGGSATFTGDDCNPWAGGIRSVGCAIQGNILTGPEVVQSMHDAWLGSDAEPDLSRRLIAVLAAGDGAGGDRRGRQSASLLVVSPGAGYGGGNDILVDLRVDDHTAPVAELSRLLDLHDLYFGSSRPEDMLALVGPLLTEVSGLLVAIGYPPEQNETRSVNAALSKWAGVENLEERVGEEALIDPVVLQVLRERAKS